MDNILLVSKSQKVYDTLKEFLYGAGICNITWVCGSNKARRLLAYNNFSLCIIDMPLPDENGCLLALHIVQSLNCSCLLLAAAGNEDDIAAAVEDYGVMVISKPVNPHFFYKTVKFALSSGRRINDTNSENKRLQQKLEQLKTVARAKLVLMEKLKMTETQAHKHIEKQAMDLRISKKDVADSIIKKYEN